MGYIFLEKVWASLTTLVEISIQGKWDPWLFLNRISFYLILGISSAGNEKNLVLTSSRFFVASFPISLIIPSKR